MEVGSRVTRVYNAYGFVGLGRVTGIAQPQSQALSPEAKGEEILVKIQRAWKVALREDKDVTINQETVD